MARSLRIEHSGAGDYVGFVPAQVILVGVLAFPIVVAGVRHLARRTDLRFVLVAVAVVVGYVFAVIPGREYYTAGMLPVLFAAGACRVEQRRTDRRGRRRWLAAPVVGAALTVAFVLPVLPLSTFARMTFLHTTSYDLGETVGWPQLTDRVAAVYDTLATPVRRDTAVFTSNYGEAARSPCTGPHWAPRPALGAQQLLALGSGRRPRPDGRGRGQRGPAPSPLRRLPVRHHVPQPGRGRRRRGRDGRLDVHRAPGDHGRRSGPACATTAETGRPRPAQARSARRTLPAGVRGSAWTTTSSRGAAHGASRPATRSRQLVEARARPTVVGRDHPGHHPLAPLRVGPLPHRHLGHAGVGGHHLLDRRRPHLLAPR